MVGAHGAAYVLLNTVRGVMSINLLLSLIFAAGQIVVGAGLAWYGVRRGRWRAWRAFLAALAGMWFVVSGTIEALVSGMEVSQRLTGAPDAATFALVRGRGDSTLLVATVALAICGALYAAWSLHELGAGETRGRRQVPAETERDNAVTRIEGERSR